MNTMTEIFAPFAAEAQTLSEANVRLAQRLVANATALKREPPSLDASPIAGVADYGGAGHTLQLALIELDEAVPGGQAARVALALRGARLAFAEYEAWLRAKGYAV